MNVQTKWYFWWVLLPVICLLWGSNSYNRPEIVEKLERIVYDRHLNRLDEPQLDTEIVLVMAGEDSISRLGRWPWPRSIHAKLLENLTQAQTVVMDILFPEPSQFEDDLALVSSAKRTKNLVLAMHLSSNKSAGSPRIIEPFSTLSSASDALGFTNMETDHDGLVRYCKPYRIIEGRIIPSLPLATAYSISARSMPLITMASGNFQKSMDEMNIPVDMDNKLWINHGKSNAQPYEYYQVLNGDVSEETFKDKIVLVGVSASGIEDYFKIPFESGSREITGTQLNCNIIKSLLSRKVPHRVPPIIDGLLTVIVVLAGAALTLINRPIWNFFSLIILAFSLFFLHQHLFVSNYIYTAMILPLSGMIAAFSIFLFLKLKLIHQETEIKTFSISSIIGLPRELGRNIKSYDDYIRSIWNQIEKSTGMRLISPRTTLDEVDIPALLEANTRLETYHDNVILVEDEKGPYKHVAMVPVSSCNSTNAYEYTLLGWQQRLSESHIQAILAVVLSTSWYFELLKQADEQKLLLLDTIHAISAAIDAKDPVTGGHSNRVSTLALKLSEHLNIDEKARDDIYLGALIHDIGKIGVPDRILSKNGQLTVKEIETIQKHPTVGKKIMTSVKLPETTLRAMYEHHERCDGTGYPLGLNGDEINLAGKIIAVADVFDALISDRPYRKALPIEKALSYMKQNSGVKFDDAVVSALGEIVSKEYYPSGIC